MPLQGMGLQEKEVIEETYIKTYHVSLSKCQGRLFKHHSFLEAGGMTGWRVYIKKGRKWEYKKMKKKAKPAECTIVNHFSKTLHKNLIKLRQNLFLPCFVLCDTSKFCGLTKASCNFTSPLFDGPRVGFSTGEAFLRGAVTLQ